MNGFRVAVLVSTASLFAVSAHASAVYQYTGNGFTGCVPLSPCSSLSVTGTITLSAVLPANTSYPNFPQLDVLDFSFSAGAVTIDMVNVVSTPVAFNAGTDQFGTINVWDFSPLDTAGDQIITANVPSDSFVADSYTSAAFFPIGNNMNDPGQWKLLSSDSGAPEPGSYALTSAGLALLALIRRRIRSGY